jgi:N-acetylneuraminic acid mutarotase
MRKCCLIVVLGLCLILVPATLGCTGTPDTTGSLASTTTALAPLTTTTVEIITTTTTTEAPGAWTQLLAQNAPEELPDARMGSTLTYEPATGRLLLFGGWDGAEFFDTIWSYDLAANTWAGLDTGGNPPSARALHSVVYLSDAGKLLMFGGYNGSVYLGDTWAYDVAADSWTDLAPSGNVPEARDGHSLVYDASNKKVYLFGGWNGAKEFSDTWVYDPAANTWTELRPAGDVPVARDSQAMVFEPKTGKVVLFGGWNQTTDFGDTWLYDPAANTWTEASPAGEGPSSRALSQMVCEASTGKVMLFGGGNSGNVATADMWVYDPAANTWAQIAPAGTLPAGRSGLALAYDSGKGRLFLFGGADKGAFFNDVWTYVR